MHGVDNPEASCRWQRRFSGGYTNRARSRVHAVGFVGGGDLNGASEGRQGGSPASSQLISVAKGGGWLAAGDLVNYVARFVAALVLARFLGADGYGLYTLTVSLLFLASGLGNLGLDATMERYTAVLTHRGDSRGMWGTLQLGLGITIVSSIITSSIVFFAADAISRGLFDDDRLASMFRIGAFVVPFLIATSLLASIVRGFKRMDYSALTENFLQPVVRLTLIFILAITGLTSTIALAIFGISYLAAVIVLVGLVHRLHPLNRPLRDADRYVKEVATFSFPFWFAGVLTQLRKSLQPVLLGVYSTVANIGIISLVKSANLLGRVAVISIGKALRPTLAVALDQGRDEETGHLYQATTRWTLSANLPIFVLMVLHPVAILSLFGESFEAGATALIIVAFGELANAASGTCGAIIDMSGLTLVKSINKIFEVAFTIAMNVLLVPAFGLVGAAFAFTISRTVLQIVRLVEVQKLLGFQPYNIRIMKPLLAATAAFGAGIGVDWWIPATTGVLPLALNAFAIVMVYVAMTIALGVSEEDKVVIAAVAKRLPIIRSRVAP